MNPSSMGEKPLKDIEYTILSRRSKFESFENFLQDIDVKLISFKNMCLHKVKVEPSSYSLAKNVQSNVPPI